MSKNRKSPDVAANEVKLEIYVGMSPMYHGTLDRPTELGRENDEDVGKLYCARPMSGGYRIPIAGKELVTMSRQLMLITPINGHEVQITSLSQANVIHVEAQEPLWPKQQRKLSLPVILNAVDRRIEIKPQKAEIPEDVLLSLNDQPMAPPGSEDSQGSIDLSRSFPLAGKLSDQDNGQLIRWLGAVTRVLHSTVSSADFYERAAKEMVDLIGLDSGRVLDIVDGGRWTVATSYHRRGALLGPSSEWIPISNLIQRVINEKRTLWTTPSGNIKGTVGTEDVTVAVAAPLLDRTGKVVGVLYGDRHTTGSRMGAMIDNLEALLVETLARGVSTGRARVDQERKAAEAQVRFEQFFTPELSRQLAANADLLTRRDAEVTLLFADIRKFSAISEQHGAEVTMKWLSDVMGKMADCAAAYDGTLVDYIGDELMVMWGAPAQQPDHATRACQTALDMARLVKELDEKWHRDLGHRTRLGFGVNTGSARVGNVGFDRKFRYAPFGNTVNTASRVQGATKYLGADVVVTGATFVQLRGEPLSRRLCSVRAVNIEEPIILHELCPVESPEVKQLCQQYEDALVLFEKQDLAHSINILSDILRNHPDDGPTLLLLARAVDTLQHRDQPFDPVFELPGK